MFQTYRLKHAVLKVANDSLQRSPVMAQTLSALPTIEQTDVRSDLTLSESPQGLQLEWFRAESKPLIFQLDFVKTAQQLRSFPAPKQGAFNQALGKKSRHIIDATGGWGGDALLMCLQGYQVTIIERLPLMAVLLDEAFSRLQCSEWASHNAVTLPTVVAADAHGFIKHNQVNADCVYLDPMFPAKRKKSAVTNKHMQLLQWLAGPDADASELAQIATEHYARIVVKRPNYAQPLIVGPSVQFSSKLVHYDVYLGS